MAASLLIVFALFASASAAANPCAFALVDSAARTWLFDVRALDSPSGYDLPRPDVEWSISMNLCGPTPKYCASDKGAQYVSYGSAIQFFTSAPPEPGSMCPSWDPPFAPVKCSYLCVPIAYTGAFVVEPLDSQNVGTGGLAFRYVPTADSPYDTFACPPDPNRNLPMLRSWTVNLLCDANGTKGTITWLKQVEEPSDCQYVGVGSAPEACGVAADGPFASPSPTASTTATATATATGTATATTSAVASATPSASAAPAGNGLINGVFSPLDRDVGIGGLGALLGAITLGLCILGGKRRMMPWQWMEESSGRSSLLDGAPSLRTRVRSGFAPSYGALGVTTPSSGAGAGAALQGVQEYR